jgi:hypothetical protein
MDATDSWISILNELASDLAIYPRQECPLVMLHDDEDRMDKYTEYVDGLEMDRTKIKVRGNTYVSHIADNFVDIKDGIVFPTVAANPGTHYYNMIPPMNEKMTMEANATMDTKVRLVLEHYMRHIRELYEELAKIGYIPRFILGSVFRHPSQAHRGIYTSISSLIVCDFDLVQ